MSQPSGPVDTGYGQPAAEFGAPGTVHQPPPPPKKQPRAVNTLRFGIVGAAIVLVGGVAVTLAYTTFSWFSQSDSTFSMISHRLSRRDFVTWVSQAYFSWLGWVLLGVVFVVAMAANFPQQRLMLLRPAGFVLALVATGLTFWAIKFTTTAHPTYLDYLRSERLGFYFAAAGFLVMGIGSLVGAPRR